MKYLLNSNNKTVKIITGMGLYGKHSIIGANARHLIYKYDLNCKVVDQMWRTICMDQDELVRIGDQIKELCYMRDTYKTGYLSVDNTKDIIDILCTE